mmetsp:Transcript_31295/g.66232  ORF Transcript_31295/g.66232 Transcript_31295/m.66232 type:complete len:117 (+) Transcript_31295:303-653(+)
MLSMAPGRSSYAMDSTHLLHRNSVATAIVHIYLGHRTRSRCHHPSPWPLCPQTAIQIDSLSMCMSREPHSSSAVFILDPLGVYFGSVGIGSRYRAYSIFYSGMAVGNAGRGLGSLP